MKVNVNKLFWGPKGKDSEVSATQHFCRLVEGM